MGTSSNYVVALWSGPRRAASVEYERDSSYYLRWQIEALTRVKHNLSRITFVVSHNPAEPLGYRILLNSIPDQIQDADVNIIERPNIGISYGAYSEAFGRVKNKFKWWFFMEDDHIIVKDNFDTELIERFESLPNCGMLSGLVRPPGFHGKHAAQGNMLVSNEALLKLWLNHGHLPHARGSVNYGELAQLDFSKAFVDAGYELYDIIDSYQLPFWTHLKTIVDHGDKNLPYMIVPIQYLNSLEGWH